MPLLLFSGEFENNLKVGVISQVIVRLVRTITDPFEEEEGLTLTFAVKMIITLSHFQLPIVLQVRSLPPTEIIKCNR